MIVLIHILAKMDVHVFVIHGAGLLMATNSNVYPADRVIQPSHNFRSQGIERRDGKSNVRRRHLVEGVRKDLRSAELSVRRQHDLGSGPLRSPCIADLGALQRQHQWKKLLLRVVQQ